MTFPAGERLGQYEIVSLIGHGGMGEVYRARDSRLKREVALKVIPLSVAHDAQRLARFQREAEVLASLNHPHIAQIYGIEDIGTSIALVMELVDGEDLTQRIARGPIPLDEALAIGQQLIEALTAAHDAGIVHRDLKPANIKLRPDGTVKVLDFGLAKGVTSAATGAEAEASDLHTFTSPAMTHVGMILGTAAYMAPEQARGKPVDKRADIWAFGCVLYEMLTAEPLFRGDAVTDVLASVVKDQPDLSKAPPTVRRLLTRCLEKDPRRRLRDLGDAWELLESGAAPDRSARRAPRVWLPWAVAAVLALVVMALGAWIVRRPAAAPPLVQFRLDVPEEAGGTDGVISPDGRRILYSRAGQLLVRDLSSLAATVLPGTDSSVVPLPFWSADSRSVFFSSGGAMKKVDVAGGPPQTICPIEGRLFGGFTTGDRVIFSTGALFMAPLAGGPASALRITGNILGGSSLLPDGKHFLYSVLGQDENARGVFVATLAGDEAPRRVLPDVSPVAFVRAPAGQDDYLLFERAGALVAQRFNPDTLVLSGDPVTIVDRAKRFTASEAGSIVYRAGDAGRKLTWLDRQGKTLGTVGAPDQHLELALSPDGSRAAVVRNDQQTPPSTWIFEFARDASSRVAFKGAAIKPVWSTDGKQLFVTTASSGSGVAIVRTASNGPVQADALFESTSFKAPRDVSPDGKWLLYMDSSPTTKEDLWLLPLTPGERKPEPFLVTDYIETDGMFSPDGRFVAYVSNESGRFEVYVRSFPVTAGGKWRVTQGGGYQPRWRRDAKELFFFTADGRLMSTDIRAGVTFDHTPPRTLFQVPIFSGGATTTNHYWDVSPDGQRFLINTADQDAGSSMLTVVLNWRGGVLPTGRN